MFKFEAVIFDIDHQITKTEKDIEKTKTILARKNPPFCLSKLILDDEEIRLEFCLTSNNDENKLIITAKNQLLPELPELLPVLPDSLHKMALGYSQATNSKYSSQPNKIEVTFTTPKPGMEYNKAFIDFFHQITTHFCSSQDAISNDVTANTFKNIRNFLSIPGGTPPSLQTLCFFQAKKSNIKIEYPHLIENAQRLQI